MSSLIPERSLVISPSLAATIGLEESVLLTHLNLIKDFLNVSPAQGFDWFETGLTNLSNQLPFWSVQDIQRISESLRDKGVLLIGSAPLGESGVLRFAFNELAHQATSDSGGKPLPADRSTGPSKRANTIAPNWQPDNTVLTLLSQRGVPQQFARDQIAEFVQYWYERGETRHAWGNRFISHVMREWRQFEQKQNLDQEMDLDSRSKRQPEPIADNWQPGPDAMEILLHQAEIPREFILDAVPEFVLYWREKGEHSNTWNARFINHIKRQWHRFRNTLENDTEPNPIRSDWYPDPDVFDVLSLAHIDTEFAREKVKEFVIYWRDRQEARASWNSTYIQFIKQQWKLAHTSSDSTRQISLSDELSDRSWAN